MEPAASPLDPEATVTEPDTPDVDRPLETLTLPLLREPEPVESSLSPLSLAGDAPELKLADPPVPLRAEPADRDREPPETPAPDRSCMSPPVAPAPLSTLTEPPAASAVSP